jgi:SAM-dependent methyltransferase
MGQGRSGEQGVNSAGKPDPEGFFRALGLRPIAEEDLAGELGVLGGDALVAEFRAALAAAERDPLAPARFFHADPDRTRIGLGLDFERLCEAARFLATLAPPPRPRILDVGGGPGALALWMVERWPGGSVTVADPLAVRSGGSWAGSPGTPSIRFLRSALPELEGVEEDPFDLIVISSVLETALRSAARVELPPRPDPSSPSARRAARALGTIIRALEARSTPEGHLVLLEGWTRERLRLLSRALRDTGVARTVDLSRVADDEDALTMVVLDRRSVGPGSGSSNRRPSCE